MDSNSLFTPEEFLPLLRAKFGDLVRCLERMRAHNAEDLAQEAFMRLWMSLGAVEKRTDDPERAAFSWLLTTSGHLLGHDAKKEKQRQKRERDVALRSGTPSPTAGVGSQVDAKHLVRQIYSDPSRVGGKDPALDLMILWLRAAEGLSAKEVARSLEAAGFPGISEGDVNTRYSRTCERIRQNHRAIAREFEGGAADGTYAGGACELSVLESTGVEHRLVALALDLQLDRTGYLIGNIDLSAEVGAGLAIAAHWACAGVVLDGGRTFVPCAPFPLNWAGCDPRQPLPLKAYLGAEGGPFPVPASALRIAAVIP